MQPSGIQYGPVNVGQAPKIQMSSLDRSSTPLIPGYMDPNVYFLLNGYPSAAFYFGGGINYFHIDFLFILLISLCTYFCFVLVAGFMIRSYFVHISEVL